MVHFSISHQQGEPFIKFNTINHNTTSTLKSGWKKYPFFSKCDKAVQNSHIWNGLLRNTGPINKGTVWLFGQRFDCGCQFTLLPCSTAWVSQCTWCWAEVSGFSLPLTKEALHGFPAPPAAHIHSGNDLFRLQPLYKTLQLKKTAVLAVGNTWNR